MPSLTEFIQKRRPSWDELNRLIQITGARTGVKRLTRDELRRLGPLYRRTAADLAYIRLRGGDAPLCEHLNALVLRAHGLIYAERGPGATRLRRFFTYGFPALLWRRAPYIWLAFGLFMLGFAIGVVMQMRDPMFLTAMGDDPEARRDMYKDMPTESDATKPEMAAMLMTHNTQVAFTAFALGILGAAPAAYPLILTGLQVGALTVEQHKAGNSIWFWSFLSPHAVPELTAIFISAGAGMLIGRNLFAPGEHTRRDALKLAGGEAVRMTLGTIVMFIFAGLTESFVSPSAIPPWTKFAYLGVMSILLTLYLRLGKPKEVEVP
ncbi:MAG: stage II sporulation protein M [Armatimonas sp.]